MPPLGQGIAEGTDEGLGNEAAGLSKRFVAQIDNFRVRCRQSVGAAGEDDTPDAPAPGQGQLGESGGSRSQHERTGEVLGEPGSDG